MDQMNRRSLMAAAAAVSIPRLAHATLPPIRRLLVPFAAGGPVDFIARRLANSLNNLVATSVIVENKPGASGRLAVDLLLQAPADGLTLMLHSGGVQSLYPHTFKKLSYAPFTDIAPVSLTARYEFGFAVGPGVPAHVSTLRDYLDWVKSSPQRTGFGTPGAGTPYHFIPMLLGKDAGLDLIPVHYRGTAPAIQDVLAGHIPAVSSPLGPLMDLKAEGRLRVLASSAAMRTNTAPDVATYAEQGFPQFTREDWYAVYVHGKTPPDSQEYLSSAIQKALASPLIKSVFEKHQYRPSSSTPAEALSLARQDYEYWGKIIRTVKYQPEEML